MARTKIRKLSDYISTATSPFLWKTMTGIEQIPEFLRDVNFQESLTRYMNTNFGDYTLLTKYQIAEEDARNMIPLLINYQYIANAYMLNGLWETTQLDYNPIENYRMEEVGKDSNSGVDTTSHNLGATNIQQIAGERVDTVKHNLGATNVQQITGERTDTAAYGSQDTTNTHEVSPESSGQYTAESRDKQNLGTHTDNLTTGSQTVTTKGDAVINSDNLTTGTQTVTMKGDAVYNTDSLEHGHVPDLVSSWSST